jgi:hypothetical protein
LVSQRKVMNKPFVRAALRKVARHAAARDNENTRLI